MSAESAHFHHVHLNVTDPECTLAFYERFFGAVRLRYRGLADALFTERSFLLLNRVDAPPEPSIGSTLWHIGWSGTDPEGSQFLQNLHSEQRSNYTLPRDHKPRHHYQNN